MARNTGILLLLLAGSLLRPISLRAQSGNPGEPFEVLSLTKAATAAPADTPRVSESPSAMENGWVVGIGAVNASYHSGATIATGGLLIPGAPATVSNNLTLMFDVRRYITKEFSLSLMGGVPPKPTITGKGSVASLGELGKVRYVSAILTADYRLPMDAFRPDVGAGTAYAIILKEHDAAVSQVGAHNNWGFVLKGVAEHPLSRNLAMFVDVKGVWPAVKAHDSPDDVVPVTANVNLNPTIVSVGIRLHLHRGYLSR